MPRIHIHSMAVPYLLAALLFLIVLSPAIAKNIYESPSNLKAADFLPQKLFSNTAYSIDKKIKNDGFSNIYTVTSKVGTFQANSTIALYKLLGEIDAIEQMKSIEKSDAFISSLKESGVNTVDGLKKLFTAPRTSLQNAASGINSLFNRAEESIFKSSPGKTEDSRLEQSIGFSKTKREIAFRYKVDVYSENEVLQDHLNRLAWAEYAGGLAVGAATVPLGGAAGATLTVSGTTRLLGEIIATTPPAQLKLQNRAKLNAMQIDENLIDLFIENPNFSPLQQTVFILSLEKTAHAQNCSLPLQTALQASDQQMAGALTALMHMLAGYHEKVSPIIQFVRIARIFGAIDSKGNLIVVLPADYITWNMRLASALETIDIKKSKQHELWILGSISIMARNQLQTAGWKIFEKIGPKINFQM